MFSYDPLEDYLCNRCGKRHEFCRCGEEAELDASEYEEHCEACGDDVEDDEDDDIFVGPICETCKKPDLYCDCDEQYERRRDEEWDII